MEGLFQRRRSKWNQPMEKLFIEGQEVADFEAWLCRAPKKVKKIVKNRMHLDKNEVKPWGKVYMTVYLTKKMSKCDMPWLRERAIEQAAWCEIYNSVF